MRTLILVLLLPFTSFSQQKPRLEEMAAQMIMIGLPDNVIDTNSTFYKDVRAGKMGGITMYERHLTATNTAENLKKLIATYQQISPLPLFISITQEGGLVNRLKPKYGFPPMPSAEYLGKLNNLDSTKYYADTIARTLSELGININFAPVVDIYKADNPVLGSRERNFSYRTDIIIKHAEQVIKSHNHFNVITVLKHFPGHGSSTQDSHLELTDVSTTWKKEELEPYIELLKKELVQGVMTAHIVNKQLDPSALPATLSYKIIEGELRRKLKFDGVVFSDDMHMKAISSEYDVKDAIEKAINAGVDVLLFSGNISDDKTSSASNILHLIIQLVEENKISKIRIEESYNRIMKMKKALVILKPAA
ncbi:MAG: glycoside hydrolase family 3 protein [Chitinophagaceae bacterium]